MFRVLSDDESKNVTRWKAPELGSEKSVVANTRQQANPSRSTEGVDVQALLGSLELKPGNRQKKSASPRLQSVAPVDVFANGAIIQGLNVDSSALSDEMAPVSAELLQSSYDEGYSNGFAEGSAALHEKSIKELKSVITALSAASRRNEDTELEFELVGLSLDIARLIMQREISLAPEIMHEIVKTGLDQLAVKSAVQRVFMHPLDASTVRAQLDQESSVVVVDDPTLSRYAVRIESGASEVNAGIEDWLDIVSAQLGLVADSEHPLPARSMEMPDGGSVDVT